MSLYDSERRYRRRVWGGVIRFVIFVGVVVAAAMTAYEFGAEDIQGERRLYQAQLAEFERARGAAEQEAADLRVEVEKARLAVREWERRYETDVPTGTRLELLDLVTERLAAGVDPERLAFLIKAAEDKRECEEIETKRFLVRTPLYDGANTAVTFANDAVAVTGSGESETTDAGLPQAWYDPQKPVRLVFTRIDGQQTLISGILPLQQSVVHDGVEHHFMVKPGARGFAQVAAERCAYP
ncbi:MAG: hypothetical protein NXI18_15575 [Alphaproteobacteria bacterium]|nr:hypothetical protein [Alphaproteobacteria bacterium]